MDEFNQSCLPRVEFCRVCNSTFLSSSNPICPWCSGMESGDLDETRYEDGTDEMIDDSSCTFCGIEDRYAECEGDCGTAACKMCYKLGALKEYALGYPAYFCKMCAPPIKRTTAPS